MASYSTRKPQSATLPAMGTQHDILIAYTCGHYEVIQASDYNNVVPALFEEARMQHRKQNLARLFGGNVSKGPRSLDDLWTKTSPKYVSVPTVCEKTQCQKATARAIEATIKTDLFKLHQSISKVILDCHNLGIRYHNVVPAARAKFAFDADCQLAHRQFTIEKRHWKLDPFFEPLQKMRKHVEKADVLIRSTECPSRQTLTEILRELNMARAYYYVPIMDQQEELVKGVRKLEHAVSVLQYQPQALKVPNAFGRTKMNGKVKLTLAPCAIPTMVFELACWENWKKRMEGLEPSTAPAFRKVLRTDVDLG